MRILNANIVTRNNVLRGSLEVENGFIADLGHHASGLAGADWSGDWLIPGLIELHTDNLEKHFSPRPGVVWPAIPAVVAHDAQLAASGITTVLDAIALGDVSPRGARREHFDTMLRAIEEARAAGLLRAEHRLHLRCELSSSGVTEVFDSLAREHNPALVSLMDHTPGQRQFTDLGKYREYYQGKYGLSDAEMTAFTARQIDCQRRYSAPNRDAIVAKCRAAGIALASHDDATVAHVQQAASEGVVLSEFPTSMAAAAAARQRGMAILMGAPNVVRGGSHSGNISALALAAEGFLDVLSSDYVPASLLHAAFLVHEKAGWSLPDALRLVSANPAGVAGLHDRGEIEPGKRADFLRVHIRAGIPAIVEAWRSGRRIH